MVYSIEIGISTYIPEMGYPLPALQMWLHFPSGDEPKSPSGEILREKLVGVYPLVMSK